MKLRKTLWVLGALCVPLLMAARPWEEGFLSRTGSERTAWTCAKTENETDVRPDAESAPSKDLFFFDTLRTEGQRKQMMKAIELAPTTFTYTRFDGDGKSYVSVVGLRFNESMREALKSDILAQDPDLARRMRRLYLVVRPLSVSGDLTVRYKNIPEGMAVEYQISQLYMWGRRAPDRLVRQMLKDNNA